MKINANTFKQARESTLISSTGLARACGLTPKTIRQIESDEARPRLDTIRKVLEGLGLTLEEALKKNIVQK
ncbi:MAG: helix-turn-helix domain-containing protein [Deltaproteobacteria bacterium]|nr:helix-turn-helix domain-containing protein [Deltaproteobacteria bacterium]